MEESSLGTHRYVAVQAASDTSTLLPRFNFWTCCSHPCSLLVPKGTTYCFPFPAVCAAHAGSLHAEVCCFYACYGCSPTCNKCLNYLVYWHCHYSRSPIRYCTTTDKGVVQQGHVYPWLAQIIRPVNGWGSLLSREGLSYLIPQLHYCPMQSTVDALCD